MMPPLHDWTQIVNKQLLDHEDRLAALEQDAAVIDADDSRLRALERWILLLEMRLREMGHAAAGADGV
jgi:hypothetical protein